MTPHRFRTARQFWYAGPGIVMRSSADWVRDQASYQVMLGAFSAALLVLGSWWNPITEPTNGSLTFSQKR